VVYLDYLNRIIPAYILKENSQLNFWHEEPEVNPDSFKGGIDEYYMTFFEKAGYRGPFDGNGIPLLDYKGKIGLQHNPIAIAQYGIGNFNLYKQKCKKDYLDKALKAADWLKDNLKKNKFGLGVWNHNFDWEYRSVLKAPWYSALSQGQGISLLVRVYVETGKSEYAKTASAAFKSLLVEIGEGGVLFIDENNNRWLEEYISNPPTHILNGFIWALWGVYDYFLLTKEKSAARLWDECLKTLKNNLEKFDIEYWSLYDLSAVKMKNIASLFYHKLHIVQMDVLYRLSGIGVFKEYNNKWKVYLNSTFNKSRAYCSKAIFKLRYF